MFRFLSLAAASMLVATGVSAYQPDRTDDRRLGTALTSAASNKSATVTPIATLSSKGRKRKTPYAYTNPYGVGPHNDSR